MSATLHRTEGWKHWCETCEGTGSVYQEHQAGCHVGGDFPCPDCDGNGYWVPRVPPCPSGWQPIAAAPRDGSTVLVNDTTGLSVYCMAHYLAGIEWEGWVYDDEIALDNNPLGPQPTHFMVIDPLPPAPNQGEAS